MKSTVTAFDVSTIGDIVAMITADGTVKFVRLSTKTDISEFDLKRDSDPDSDLPVEQLSDPNGHSVWIRISADGKSATATIGDERVFLFSIEPNKVIAPKQLNFATSREDGVVSLPASVASPDQLNFLFHETSTAVNLVNSDVILSSVDSQFKSKVYSHEDEAVLDFGFLDNGKRIVTLTDHGKIRTWTVTKGDGESRLFVAGRDATKFVPDETGKLVAILFNDGSFRLYDSVQNDWVSDPFRVYGEGFEAVRFVGDGNRILSYTTSGQLSIWDARPGRIREIEPNYGDSYSPTYRKLFDAERLQEVGWSKKPTWDARSCSEVEAFTSTVGDPLLISYGNAVVATQDSILKLHHLETGKTSDIGKLDDAFLGQLPQSESQGVTFVADAEGKTLLAMRYDADRPQMGWQWWGLREVGREIAVGEVNEEFGGFYLDAPAHFHKDALIIMSSERVRVVYKTQASAKQVELCQSQVGDEMRPTVYEVDDMLLLAVDGEVYVAELSDGSCKLLLAKKAHSELNEIFDTRGSGFAITTSAVASEGPLDGKTTLTTYDLVNGVYTKKIARVLAGEFPHVKYLSNLDRFLVLSDDQIQLATSRDSGSELKLLLPTELVDKPQNILSVSLDETSKYLGVLWDNVYAVWPIDCIQSESCKNRERSPIVWGQMGTKLLPFAGMQFIRGEKLVAIAREQDGTELHDLASGQIVAELQYGGMQSGGLRQDANGRIVIRGERRITFLQIPSVEQQRSLTKNRKPSFCIKPTFWNSMFGSIHQQQCEVH